MTKLLNFFIICLLTFSLNSKGQMVVSFEEKIKNKCPKVVTIQVKKALLEMLKTSEEECTGPFISHLLNLCPKIACGDLYSYYEEAKYEHSGNVIGTSKLKGR